jgi:hypothetical protein
VRCRYRQGLIMVEADVNISTADSQHRFIDNHVRRMLGDCKIPGAAKILRPRYDDIVPTLHPRCIKCLPVMRVNLDLSIKLSRGGTKERARRIPRNAVVTAGLQNHSGRNALWTFGHRSVLRKKNVYVTLSVCRQRGFPLVPHVVSEAALTRESRICLSSTRD